MISGMETDLKKLWGDCLLEIEGEVTKANFTTWFKQTSLLSEEDGIISIAVPNEFVREWMTTKYQKLVLRILVAHLDHIRGVVFVVGRPSQNTEAFLEKKSTPTELPLDTQYVNKDDNLNPRYTFDRFIVGPFNELAFAAAMGVVKNPLRSYNPLFFYGSSGLGKTHLIQGIGNEIKKTYPEKKVLYVSAEKFSTDYVSSVQMNRSAVFRDKYRKYDVLIIDDIQFVSGKEGTQNELFHLFNVLYEQGKNIIFSSDKHPNHILGLEERLKTRFNAGMTIDIQEPDLESRIAIIREKIVSLPYTIPDDVVLYIASVVVGSIRELEGVINILTIHTELKQKPITLTEVKNLIKNNIKPKKNISLDVVVKTIADYYNIDERILYEKTRRKEVVKARQIVMFLLREDFNESYPSIGAKLGGKDHTTVIHSYEKIKNELQQSAHLMREVEELRALFR